VARLKVNRKQRDVEAVTSRRNAIFAAIRVPDLPRQFHILKIA
jgi:hypothetical protein